MVQLFGVGMKEISEKTYWRRLLGHLKTVHQHRFLVAKHCFKCGLYYQGLVHDLSKYSLAELCPSVRYYQGDRSPYNKEKALKGYSEGLLHHLGRNKHHWEYWWDMIDGKWQAIEMPYRYVVESVCDRIAACKVYQKEKYTQASAFNYFCQSAERYYLHPKTRALLAEILQEVAENGEEATFCRLKKSLKKKK